MHPLVVIIRMNIAIIPEVETIFIIVAFKDLIQYFIEVC